MTTDREALIAVAERIAEAENRVGQLRERMTRLRDEGSDASQAREMLQVVSPAEETAETEESIE